MTDAAARTRVLLIVSGGIAAYKACEVVRRLGDAGVQVRVAMTRAATEFVAPLTFAALSGERVISSLFVESAPEEIPHIRWAEWADVICVAPATADFLARLAHGFADEFAAAVCLAHPGAMIVAPAMEDDMYRNVAVQRNLETLAERGVVVVGPDTGALASGRHGPGRMVAPEEVVATVRRVLRHGSPRLTLSGRRVVISAGPTWEALDDVRGFTNRSSGRMGYELAREAARLGAEVTLVSGPTALVPPSGIRHVPVLSAAQMHEAVAAVAGEADVAVLCAAVCDFTPANPQAGKLKKADREVLDVPMRRTHDILAGLGQQASRPFLVGFAAESDNVEEHARAKLQAKGCDVIVGNRIGGEGVGMAGDDNEVVVIGKDGSVQSFARAPKADIAVSIWSVVVGLLPPRSS